MIEAEGTGYMQLTDLIRIDVRCTGQITGGSVTTGSFIILAADDSVVYSAQCVLGVCPGDEPISPVDFDGVYLL